MFVATVLQEPELSLTPAASPAHQSYGTMGGRLEQAEDMDEGDLQSFETELESTEGEYRTGPVLDSQTRYHWQSPARAIADGQKHSSIKNAGGTSYGLKPGCHMSRATNESWAKIWSCQLDQNPSGWCIVSLLCYMSRSHTVGMAPVSFAHRELNAVVERELKRGDSRWLLDFHPML